MSNALKEFPSVINKRKTRRYFSQMWSDRWLYVMLLPAIAFMIVFHYIPLYGLTLAFRIYKPALGPYGSPWAQPFFYNFWFLRDREFWFVLGNTVKISMARLIFGFPAPIILALLLNEVAGMAFKRVIQTVTYLPHFISWVVIGGLIYKFFAVDPDSPFNIIRAVFGLDPTSILTRESFFLPMVIVSGVLKEVGWGTIIYLAAISNIDPELYEAAVMDGAGRLKQTFHITLPGMLPIIAIFMILSIPGLLQAGFDQIFNLYNPLVYSSGDIIDTLVYRIGLENAQYGLATALGLLKSVLSTVLIVVSYFLAYRFANYRIF